MHKTTEVLQYKNFDEAEFLQDSHDWLEPRYRAR